MLSQISDHNVFCHDIISGVISGLKFEERHNDVVKALRTIAGRLEMLETNSVFSDSRTHGCQRWRSSRNSQTGIQGISSLQNNKSSPIEAHAVNEDNDFDSGFASDSRVTSKADRAKGRRSSLNADVLRRLQNLEEQSNLQSFEVRECLQSMRDEMAHVAGISKNTCTPSAYHYDMSRTLDKISHTQSDHEAIVRCVNEKISVTIKDLAAHYTGMSKMLHNILQIQTAQEAIMSGVSEKMGVMIVNMSSHTTRGSDLQTSRRFQRLEQELAAIRQKADETLAFSIHYSDMSKTLQKILHTQIDQEQLVDGVNEKLSIMIENLASKTLDKLFQTHSNREAIAGCLSDLQNMKHDVVDIMRKASSSPAPSANLDDQAKDDPRASYGSISPRSISFESPREAKDHRGSRRQVSPGRTDRQRIFVNQALPPTIIEKKTASCDRGPITLGCACGYTCGTLAALERHLATNTDRSRHSAVES